MTTYWQWLLFDLESEARAQEAMKQLDAIIAEAAE